MTTHEMAERHFLPCRRLCATDLDGMRAARVKITAGGRSQIGHLALQHDALLKQAWVSSDADKSAAVRGAWGKSRDHPCTSVKPSQTSR